VDPYSGLMTINPRIALPASLVALTAFLMACDSSSVDTPPEEPPPPDAWTQVDAIPASVVDVVLTHGTTTYVTTDNRLFTSTNSTSTNSGRTWTEQTPLPAGTVIAALASTGGRLFAGAYSKRSGLCGARWFPRRQAVSSLNRRRIVARAMRARVRLLVMVTRRSRAPSNISSAVTDDASCGPVHPTREHAGTLGLRSVEWVEHARTTSTVGNRSVIYGRVMPEKSTATRLTSWSRSTSAVNVARSVAGASASYWTMSCASWSGFSVTSEPSG